MTRVTVALAAVPVALALSACGGQEDEAQNGGEPGVRVVLEADVSRLPPGADIDEALNGVKDVLERRLTAFDIADFEIEVERTNRLSMTVKGVTPEEARELIGKTAQLEFRRPVLDWSRDVVCETADASTYARPFQPGLFTVNRASNVMTCPPNEEGAVGSVMWEPATGTDSQGMERVLTGALLRPNAEVIDMAANAEAKEPLPAVFIEFTSEGSLLFEQITTELMALPLGIFLDEEMIGAPTVNQAITGGNSVITGLESEEARVLAIQLNAGALPAPLRVISIEEIP